MYLNHTLINIKLGIVLPIGSGALDMCTIQKINWKGKYDLLWTFTDGNRRALAAMHATCYKASFQKLFERWIAHRNYIYLKTIVKAALIYVFQIL